MGSGGSRAKVFRGRVVLFVGFMGIVILISLGRFPSGQREQTVNLSASPSEVRILPSPFLISGRVSKRE
jgi:hypothetical protein